MTKRNPSLERVEGHDTLWTVRKGNLRCTIVGLPDGSVCLYSPVEKTGGIVAETHDVRFLLAPNHYHNKAVSEHVQLFGEARLVCTDAARPRLDKITGQRFEPLSSLADALPDNVEFAEPEGLKTGELWLIVRTGNELAWIVTDAFCGLQDNENEAAHPGFLKTFPKYGLKDKARFSDWVRERLEEESPTMIIPCHGEIVRGTSLRTELDNLLKTL
ncbi:hypothetical protein ABVF61_26955 [Roseibium sp. HPY-6]|uniref:hypothetical protein n=1 Tax=Roseibium sp. HPY-6 TaxID=3229852 RepID=UPI00338FB777